jgi:hypothetical protein
MFVLLTLGACGFNGGGASGTSASEIAWSNPHPELHDLAADRYACMKQAAQAIPPKQGVTWNPLLMPYSYDMNSKPRDDLFIACMNTKEWVQQSEVPAKP